MVFHKSGMPNVLEADQQKAKKYAVMTRKRTISMALWTLGISKEVDLLAKMQRVQHQEVESFLRAWCQCVAVDLADHFLVFGELDFPSQ